MSFYRKKIFPLLAGLLWLTFLTLDLAGLGDSTWVKFAAVCLCCLTALLGAGTADGRLVAAALCLTVSADWFLLVRNHRYALGVGLFTAVQLLYAFRLWRLRGRRPCPPGLTLRLVLLLICCLLAQVSLSTTCGAGLPLYMILSLFYFLNLCLNMAEAFALKNRPFALGLLLFVLCDLCVGACNLGLWTSFTWWASWLFYLPSQVLIVLSQGASCP